MPKVLISDKLSPAAVDVFTRLGIEADLKPGLDKEELAAIIGGYDGLAVRSATKVTAKLLDSAAKLKVVGRAGIGIDNIDLQAATAHGVIVMNAPMGNSITTAEHAIAMMMALARDIPQADLSTQAGKWEKSRFMGVELTGKILGIIGCGNVGSLVAERALGIKMKVIAADPFLSDERAAQLGVEKVELADLLRRADLITLHTPLTPKTRHIINRESLAQAKQGVHIINCARGELVEEEALKEALLSGHVAGAALDVFSEEPARENILFGVKNVICTPHLGASTTEAQEKVALQIAEQMANYLKDGVVANALNMPSISAEDAPRVAPFIELAEHLGAFAGQLAHGAISRVEIEYVGDDVQSGREPLTAALLAGVMKPFFDGINMVSAPVRARDAGITISENYEGRGRGAYENYIRVILKQADSSISVAGTVFSDSKPRIIQVGGINMEAEFAPYMLYVESQDAPGFIGALGQKLGEEGVNIASLALGREAHHGKAVSIIAIDEPASDDALGRLAATQRVTRVEQMSFADAIIHENHI